MVRQSATLIVQPKNDARMADNDKIQRWGLRQRGPLKANSNFPNSRANLIEQILKHSDLSKTFQGTTKLGIQLNLISYFQATGLSCLGRIKLSDREENHKGMQPKHLWSHLARRNWGHLARTNFSKEIEQTGTLKIPKLK